MNTSENSALQNAKPAEALTLGEKFGRIIDDPFGSVIAGIVAPTAAVAVVISGIYGLALIA